MPVKKLTTKQHEKREALLALLALSARLVRLAKRENRLEADFAQYDQDLAALRK
jgi:hypothetical protein